MRLGILLLFVSCSLQYPLKFKYNSSKRYLASLTRDNVNVSKIQGELRDPLIFASGMDSTFLIVKLYDDEGQLLTDIDPSDLTLSTDEDIEAKPFVMKQGVYRAEILPRVKSKKISMRVDWQEKVMSPEIVLRTTTSPLKNELAPLSQEYFQTHIEGEISVIRGSATPTTATEGFSFDNMGDNKIVDARQHRSSQRSFNFDYSEQARQNMALEVDDSPNGIVSHTMHSLFMFFPRKSMFLVKQLSGTIEVTLTNGEKMVFQKESKEIMEGVFIEGPVDISKDKTKRKYADLKYQGRGVVLRVNTRGQSPQLGQYEDDKIDTEFGVTGSVDVLIINGATGQRCRRPKADLWEPMDVSPIEFKFPTDEEFNLYLKKNCGFSLPKL